MYTAGDLRPAGDPTPTIDDFKNSAGDVWFCSRRNFFEIHPQDLKIVYIVEKHATHFSTICSKNPALN
jgi:hypothetical protein